MNKFVITAILLIVAILGGAYLYFSGQEYVIRIPEAEIQTKIAEKLPITKIYFFVIQVTLDNPRVTLENGSSRINSGLDVSLNITLNKTPKPLGGSLDVSGGIKYVAEQGKFFLINPVVEKLDVQGIPSKFSDKVNSALTKALSEYFETRPVYTLRTTDVKQAAAKLVLKNVIIENQELVVKLGI